MNDRIAQLAQELDKAVTSRTAIPQLTGHTDLTVEEAYAVQREVVAARVRRGHPVTGVKLGLTSRAKAAQMGVSDVIIGEVTGDMAVEDGGELDLTAYIHPRVEPEVAFLLARDIDPDEPQVDPESAVSAVAPALEIIDSRYRDFSFTLEDVVADNTSASGYVLGPWREFAAAGDLANRGVRLEVDGSVEQTGSTAAILGHPVRAVRAAQRMARTHGLGLPAGAVLLAGAATAAVGLRPGTSVEAVVAGLGRVGFKIKEVEAA